jgi:glutamate/tyrosine decarboxylase-like PLP-dependent enzyme
MLEKTFAIVTPYMPKVANAPLIDNFKVSAQWSRRMNSLKLWLTLRVHGRQAYEELIDRQLELAKKMAKWIEQSDTFELAAPQTLPILNFRVKGVPSEAESEAVNIAIVDAVTRDGKMWISRTTVRGQSVLRMMVISYLSDVSNLESLQKALTAAASEVLRTSKSVKASR